MTHMKIKYVGNLETECQMKEIDVSLRTTAQPGAKDAMGPTDLFAASLASCMLSVMAIQAHKLGIELKGTFADVEKKMVVLPKMRIGKVIIRIQSPLVPPEPARVKLEQAALECPVYLSLNESVSKEVDFVWGLIS